MDKPTSPPNNPAPKPADNPTPARQWPPTAAENPKAAAVLGAFLIKFGQKDNDPATVQAGEELLREAEANWPTPISEEKRLRKAPGLKSK